MQRGHGKVSWTTFLSICCWGIHGHLSCHETTTFGNETKRTCFETMWFAIWRWSVLCQTGMQAPNGLVALMARLVWRHSCVDRLLVVVRFPAGPWARLKTVDPPKGNGLGKKKSKLQTVYQKERFWSFVVCLSLSLTNSDIQTWQATICNAHNSASHEDQGNGLLLTSHWPHQHLHGFANCFLYNLL